ncbi:response regulator [Rubrivirga sp. IMCC45206]|uniref:response regulator n=1 Tax=Rubrivirga sp. IMCC45206 TaxID=3391614 RepID=UPI00398F9724
MSTPTAPDDPTPDADATRRDLRALVGHLEALRDTDLGRLQRAHLGLAVAAAQTIGQRLGAPTPSAQVPDPESLLRVLVVDDNSINVHVAMRMARVLGAEAEGAMSGDEALEALAAAPFDLVLLDVMLPGVDGMEVAREIRSRFGARPVIVGVTALSHVEKACLNAGMSAVFVKPLQLENVAAALDLAEAPATA